jgi:hypothetical protein
MAGPSVAVRVLGDLTGFGKAMTDTATAGEGTGKRLGAAFKGALGAINQTGVLGPFGAALDGITTAIDGIISHAKGVGPAMTGMGTAIAGIGIGFSAIGSKDAAAHKQLQTAIEATGKAYEDFAPQIETAIGHQEKYGTTANTTSDALRILTQATGDPAKALKDLAVASDLAAAKHESLDAAATSLGKAYNGNTRILKEFGVTVDSSAKAQKGLETAQKAVQTTSDAHAKAIQKLDDLHTLYAGKTKLTTAEQLRLRDAQALVDKTGADAATAQGKLSDAQNNVAAAGGKAGDAIGLLGDKIKGQADAAASTFSGHLEAMKAHFEDMAANLGQKYGPALTAVGTTMAGVGVAVQLTQTLLESQAAAWVADQIAAVAAAVAENVALLGIPIAIAAVVAAIAWMITHWEQTKDAVMDVYNWIVDHWPLLLSIILGPIGIAATLIIQHWSDIKNAAVGVWQWFNSVWQTVTGAITGAVSSAVGTLQGLWDTIKGDASAVTDRIKQFWDGTVAFFYGIPGRILSALGDVGSLLYNVGKQIIQGMVNGITDAVSGAVKAVQNAVGSVVSGAKSLLGIGSPSKVFMEIGVNVMEGYALGMKQQSPMVGTTMAAVLAPPTPQSAGVAAVAGPAVNIEHATFATEVDVDLLLKRAAWAMQLRSA